MTFFHASQWPSEQARSIPTAETERYVTRTQLAEIMGVSVKTVDRLVAKGMPSVLWGKQTRRFRPSIALQWARENARN